MASKDLEECSTTLTIEKMYIKTIMRFHVSPVSMAIVKKGTDDSADATLNCYSHIEIGMEVLQNLKVDLPMTQLFCCRSLCLSQHTMAILACPCNIHSNMPFLHCSLQPLSKRYPLFRNL